MSHADNRKLNANVWTFGKHTLTKGYFPEKFHVMVLATPSKLKRLSQILVIDAAILTNKMSS